MYPIIDCHCHIYPDKIAVKAARSIGSFYDMPMKYDGTLHTLLENGSKIGVKQYMVFSVATTPHQVDSINNFIAKTCRESGGLMTGLGTLHPDSSDLKGDFEKIKELGLKGVKLHPDVQGFKIDDYRCLKIYEMCEGVMPVLIHTGDYRYDFSNPNRLKPILETYTDLTVIGAHFGGWSIWEEAAEQLHGYDNIMVDCSSTFHWLTDEKIKKLIDLYTADKIIFGVDYPMWNHEQELERFLSLGLSQEDNKKILYENAMKLFDLDKKILE